MDFSSSSILKDALQYHFKYPVIFKNSLKSWKYVPWTTEQLSTQYGNILLNFRIVSKSNDDISWEGSAKYIQAGIDQFIEWQKAKSSTVPNTSPFYQYKVHDYWAYSSYNYMSHIFNGDADILKERKRPVWLQEQAGAILALAVILVSSVALMKENHYFFKTAAVNWTAFGYPETSGKDSAFWIGSAGSYTPCHFDTYGFNLVAQIQGRKRWTLFPPEDTPFMYPTRIPYEESSIFSSVNILNPDLKMHPLFKFSHPHTVTLEPGDVLFVPNKWWHFVQSLDTTVSINTWMKLNNNDTHLEEAVTRAFMTSFISYFEPVGDSWMNPNEELVSPEETLEYISLELKKIQNSNAKQNSLEELNQISPTIKASKKLSKSDVHSPILEDQIQKLLNHKDIQCVNFEAFSKWYGKTPDICSADSSQNVNAKNIIDCFVHPEVISVICKLLKNI